MREKLIPGHAVSSATPTAVKPDSSVSSQMVGRILRAGLLLFLYVVSYVALRLLPNQTYAGYLNTFVQLTGDVACIYFAFRAALTPPKTSWRGFFLGIGIASVFLLIANFAWGVVINIWAIDPNATLESLAYRIPYLLCLGFWAFAWLDLVIHRVDRSAGLSLLFTAVLIGAALAALLVRYYEPLIFNVSVANPHRVFVFLYVGLEIAALLFSTGAAIIEIHPYPLLISVGYAMLVAADFVFNTNELRDTVPQNSLAEIPWTIAQVCVALGLRFQSTTLAARQSVTNDSGSNVNAHFAIPLLSMTLGSALVGSLVTRFVHPDTVALGCYLFGAAMTAIFVSVLARTHSRAVTDFIEQAAQIGQRGYGLGRSGPPKNILKLFGSAALLENVRNLLWAMRDRTIPYGLDRMFPIEEAWASEKRHQVFIAMPFAQSWSSIIDSWLRNVISELGWSALRADESFEKRDVLSGIWKNICESEVVVADLTGRNANVLYEVGIAHCLGKPVVFICQQLQDVPFDLSTRRVVLYNLAELNPTKPRLRSALVGALGEVNSKEPPMSAGA